MNGIRFPGWDLRAALGACALLLLATWAGAWWDESARSGWSTWVSLCRNGRPDWLTVLRFYAVLMPASLLALLGAGLALLVFAAQSRSERLSRGSLAGHGACLLAMPAAIYGCALAAGAAASTRTQFATMALVDLALTLVLLPLLLALLRATQRTVGVNG